MERGETISRSCLAILSIECILFLISSPIVGQDSDDKIALYSPRSGRDGRYLFFSRMSPGESDIYWVSANFIEELSRRNNIQV